MPQHIGVDVGGTRIRVAARGGSEVRIAPTPDRLEQLPDLIAGLVEDPASIGVGCAGLVDHERGVVRWTPHMAGGELDLGAALEERCGVPVWVDNDANCAVLAEATIGAGSGHRMVLGVFVGTGIGAGLVVDGRIERGRRHLGEVGHMRMAATGHCPCGRLGCWEEHASGRALDRAARQLDPATDGRWLVDRAADGDPAAQRAIEPVAAALAEGIASLALILDPDVIVLGGIVPAAGTAVLDPVRRHLRDAGGGLAVAGLPPLMPAALGDRAGVEGAIIGATEVHR